MWCWGKALKICFFQGFFLAATVAHASKDSLTCYLSPKTGIWVFIQLWRNCWACTKRILKVKEKTSGSPGNRFLLQIHNLKCPQVLADIQGAMQEACMCKQLMEKQTQNNLTLEVYGKLKSSQATVSQGLEIRSKWPLPPKLKYLFYYCLIYFKECRWLSSSWQKKKICGSY